MVLVVASATFNAITADAIVSALPQMTREFGGGADAAFLAQMLLVTPSLSIIVGAPLGGICARRFGLKPLMLGAIALYATSGAIGLLPLGSMALILSRILLGFVSGLLGAVCLARAAEFAPDRAARLLGFANAMAASMAIGAFVLGGLLAREFGWRTANLAYLWVLLLVPVVLVSVSPAPVRSGDVDATPRQPFPWLATVPIYLATLLVFVSVYSSSIEGPFVLLRLGMIDPAQIGIAISGAAIACVFVSAVYGWIARALNDGLQFVVIFAAFFSSACITAWAQSLPVAICGLALTGIGSGILSPLLVSRLMRRVPREHAATASGLFASATFVSVFMTPPAYRSIVALGGIQVFTGLAIIAAIELAATIALAASGRLPR